MSNQKLAIEAFRRLLQEFGSAAEPYINIMEFWKDPDLLNSWRSTHEKHIQQEYLPGFHFESIKHFRWHFNERDDPFLILRGRSPSRYFDHWLRALMVPSAKHYHAEVAAAMKSGEQRYKNRLRHSGAWDSCLGWNERVQYVLGFGGIFGADLTKNAASDRTVLRWASIANRLRDERLRSNPRSAWRISEIMLEGDAEYGYGTASDHFLPSSELDRTPYYRETWVWSDDSDRPAPGSDSITFASPAPFSLWQKHWLSRRQFPGEPQR